MKNDEEKPVADARRITRSEVVPVVSITLTFAIFTLVAFQLGKATTFHEDAEQLDELNEKLSKLSEGIHNLKQDALRHQWAINGMHLMAGDMVASWYGPEFEGDLMANGSPFRCDQFTVATFRLPLGDVVKLTNKANGRFCYAVVTDRGPYIDGRDIDVSLAVALELGMVQVGTATLSVEVLPGQEGK